MKKYLVSIIFLPIVIVLFYFKSTKPAPFSSDLDGLLMKTLENSFSDQSMLITSELSSKQKGFYDSLFNDSIYQEFRRFDRVLDTSIIWNETIDSMLLLELNRIERNHKTLLDSSYDNFIPPFALYNTNGQLEKLNWYKFKMSYLYLLLLQNMANGKDVRKNRISYRVHTFFTKNGRGASLLHLKMVLPIDNPTHMSLGSYKDSFKEVYPIEIPVNRFLKENQTVTIKHKNNKTGQIREYSKKINIELK